jgi:Protein of unknown function (DUF3631)
MSGLLLDDVRAFVRRFVALDDLQADAVTLWAAHTHVFDAFPVTPYLAITSAEKRSGKTRLLEVLELLVREPLPTANISDAALFRVIAERSPSLLMDEVDAVFKSREREELRGLLNAGYRRGAVAHRMGGRTNTKLHTFPVFCPKAFAGIGDCLPDTITDRSISIRLKRRTREEHVERFRLREVVDEGAILRDRLADWLEPQLDYLGSQRPALPEELDDRAQDVWEGLLAIADAAGEDWAARAQHAACALSSGEEREDDSVTVTLLRDIHGFLSSNGHDRVKTADLLAHLHGIEESPWGDWYGKTLWAQGLSRLLKPYRIRTMPVKVDGETVRGYKSEQFEDAFSRTLALPRVTALLRSPDASLSGNASKSSSVTALPSVTSNPANHAGSNAVTPSNAYPTGEGPLVPGDEMFPVLIANAVRDGHITEREAEERYAVHKMVAVVK